MTKDVKYRCNFCNGNHFDDALIVGALWVGMELHIVSKNQSENHLCLSCIKAIHDAHNGIERFGVCEQKL